MENSPYGRSFAKLRAKSCSMFAFSGLKRLLCMSSVFLSIVFSGFSQAVQFDSELSSSLDKEILKILLGLLV